jgi:DNA-binding beta-propeller fold protein YncE
MRTSATDGTDADRETEYAAVLRSMGGPSMTARHFIRVSAVLVALASLLIPVASGSAKTVVTALVDAPPAVEVRSLYTAEWGLPHPSGLAYFPEQRALLVTGTGDSGSSVLELTPLEEPIGNFLLPKISHPATMAFDVAGGRLAVLSDRNLIYVSASDLQQKLPQVHTFSVANLGLSNPQGATFDPATGALSILDANARTIVSVPMSGGLPGSPSRLILKQLAPVRLQGLAFNPADGLVYVAAPEQDLLYGLDGSGTIQKTYSLSSVEIEDLRAMVFAPSADPTDDPGTQHLFIADAGGSSSLGGVAEVSLDAPSVTAAAAAPQVQATIVQTIDMSRLNPPSPDPSGITYFPATDRLEISDSEVEEMSIFQGVNLYQLSRTGSLTDTGVTTAYSNEPTGLGFNPANQTLFVSDDNKRRVFLVQRGSDGRFGTADDRLVSSIDVTTFGLPVDAEGVEFETGTGHVFIVDGVGREVWRVNPGPNRIFGDQDDLVTHFDVGRYGARDPEGIGFDRARNTLLVLDNNTKSIYEVRKGGALVSIINVSAVTTRRMAGVTVAPGTNNPSVMNLWVVARGVDNNANPNENDGKLFELRR